MDTPDESEWRDWEYYGDFEEWVDDAGKVVHEDPGEELEALIEQADRPFASLSFGTTAEEQEEGESLDERLKGERRSRAPLDRQLAIEDFDDADEEDELVATATFEHDHFVSPEEAAMTVRDQVPGAVDHPVAPGTEWDQPEPPEPDDPAE